MKIPKFTLAFLKSKDAGKSSYHRFPNLNLLPPELSRRLVSPLGMIMILLLIAAIGGIAVQAAGASAREQNISSSRAQLETLNRRFREASAAGEEAVKLRAQITALEETPKLYLQVVSYFDKSAIIHTVVENTPAEVNLINIQGRGTSLVMQGRAYPETALQYYLKLSKLPVFSSVIIRFVSVPEPAKEADFSIELTITGPGK